MNYKNITTKLLALTLLSTGAIFGGTNRENGPVEKHKCHTELCKRHQEKLAREGKTCGHRYNCHCNKMGVEGKKVCTNKKFCPCKNRVDGTKMCNDKRCLNCQHQKHVCQHKCHTKECKQRHEREAREGTRKLADASEMEENGDMSVDATEMEENGDMSVDATETEDATEATIDQE